MNLLRKTWESALDIFFPPICLNCRKYLEQPEKPNLICNSCLESIEINKIIFRPNPNFLLAAAASYENAALRSLIHYFKYENFLAAEKPLGEILIKYLEKIFENWKLPAEGGSAFFEGGKNENFIIIPIPLYPDKLRSRGFNQSEILAGIVSRRFDIPMETKILRRVKNTKSQIKTKNHKEREENLKGSFEISAEAEKDSKWKNKNIILVDDVYTSGATMIAALKAVRRYNKNKIIGVVAAKA